MFYVVRLSKPSALASQHSGHYSVEHLQLSGMAMRCSAAVGIAATRHKRKTDDSSQPNHTNEETISCGNSERSRDCMNM